MFTYFWLYLFCGAIAGIMSGLLFVRNDTLFIKSVAGLAPGAVPFAGFWLLDTYRPENIPIILNANATIAAGSWLLTFLIVTISCFVSARKHNITFIQMVIGEHKKIISHTKDLLTKEDELKTLSKNLKEKESGLKEQKSSLDKEKKDFIERIESHRNAVKEFREEQDKFHRLVVVSESSEFITQAHVTNCSEYNSRICKTIASVTLTTNTFSSALKKLLAQQELITEKAISIAENSKAYLKAVAIDVGEYLMLGDGSRVHFRMQGNDKVYRSIVAVYGNGGKLWNQKLRPMPFDGSLIQKSSQHNGQPIIFSLNKNSSIEPSGGLWQDFLTIAPPLPSYRGLPLFSFGISVEDGRTNINLFKHLCHVRFDTVLKNAMEPFFNIILESFPLQNVDFLKIAEEIFVNK